MKTEIDFLGKRKIAGVFSLILIALSVYVWIARGPEKYGIDFVGGQEFVVDLKQDSSADDVRNVLSSANIDSAMVQSFDSSKKEFSIRATADTNEQPAAFQKRLIKSLEEKFSGVTLLKSDTVGATIGEEVRTKAFWAITLGIIGILIYIAVRFEFSYGLGAVSAVFHDVIIATGAYLWVGHEINGSALAAALTILGYSVNDTIVIFDRVREERFKRGNYSLEKLLNESMNICLSRTLITSGLTLLAALALLILGGGAIQDLSLFLVVGILVGSYSTIYIAAPIVLWWENRKARRSK